MTPFIYALSITSLALIGVVGIAWANGGIKEAMKTLLMLAAVFAFNVAIIFLLEQGSNK